MNSWYSYPSIFNIGHKAVQDLLSVPVNVEEKIDGSQFSFGFTPEDELLVRSKGKVMQPDAPEDMFKIAVSTAESLATITKPGYTYRCEYLRKPKHNTLAYSRTPYNNLIVFDINSGHEEYLNYEAKEQEASLIGLEVVPLLFSGMLTLDILEELLKRESVLGGQKIEGVVIKPRDYNLYGLDKKVLMGKYVSEEFKEIHQGEWKKNNKSGSDILDLLAQEYATPQRWHKAVEHLRDNGALENSPRDIGSLIKEVIVDVDKECKDEIADKLMAWAWPHIKRKLTSGLPEWYKKQLTEKQFNEE